MIDKEIFMHIKELGDLYLYDVLLSYIYPRVFVCEDLYGSKYLFYEVSSKDNKDTWLVAKLTKKEYYLLVDRKKTIQKMYEKNTGFNLFSISKIYQEDEDKIELNYDAKEWIKKLPKEPVYAEKKKIDDVIQETLEAARETGETTFDIRLFSGTDRHAIPQKVLSELCGAVSAMTSSVSGQNRGDDLRVTTAPGSCIVRFSFPEQINLFNEKNAFDEMSVINNIFLSESISEKLEKVKNPKKFIDSYSKILDAIRKTNSDVQFTTASPNSTEVQKVELSRDVVKRRYDDIKDICEIEKKTEVINGLLIALDVKTKKFKLQSEDGSIISGDITKEVLENGSFELPKSYSATIEIEKAIMKNNNSKVKYWLKELLA